MRAVEWVDVALGLCRIAGIAFALFSIGYVHLPEPASQPAMYCLSLISMFGLGIALVDAVSR